MFCNLSRNKEFPPVSVGGAGGRTIAKDLDSSIGGASVLRMSHITRRRATAAQ